MAQKHPHRQFVLDELHARPFSAIENGTRILHFGHSTGPDIDPWIELAAWASREGAVLPVERLRYVMFNIADVAVSWEQHSEFITVTMRRAQPGPPFGALPADLARLSAGGFTSGQLMVAVDMHVCGPDDGSLEGCDFNPASLIASEVYGGKASMATDLRPRADGVVHWLVINRTLQPERCGALVQRLLEIETYRCFALLGLPEAQRQGPILGRIAAELARTGAEMAATVGLEANNRLLDRLTALAAELETEATHSSYRFGASKAYSEIIRQRLEIIDEHEVGEGSTLAAFLERRLAPAMRTCESTAKRQADLSEKLTRAANLLRTRVDVELERQNRDLLSAMNERTRLQLRLQQTVEGLSVAAISYYVVGLFGYFAKALKDLGLMPFDPVMATGLFVPVAIFGVWLAVRRIRRSHADAGH